MWKTSVILLLAGLMSAACELTQTPQRSTSGVTATTVKVATGSDGLTIEQRNISDRLKQDNKPGAIEHLYIISAYSGQVLMYSTVRGKVTSSGKKLAPSAVSNNLGFPVRGLGTYDTEVADNYHNFYTQEVLGDDGTYGSSVDYIYWWDSTGNYHQQYIQGGMMVHISSVPIAVKSVVLNLETRQVEEN